MVGFCNGGYARWAKVKCLCGALGEEQCRARFGPSYNDGLVQKVKRLASEPPEATFNSLDELMDYLDETEAKK